MTAQELIAALSARYLDTKQMLPDELAHEAAAMLIQQAEQIEALTKMLVISDDTHQTWMKANAPSGWIDDLRIERDALKADAKRLDLLESTFFAKRWNGVIDSGSRTTWYIVPGYQHSTNQMVGHTFRAAIDAMKGAT